VIVAAGVGWKGVMEAVGLATITVKVRLGRMAGRVGMGLAGRAVAGRSMVAVGGREVGEGESV
jgi:hypothetical protein